MRKRSSVLNGAAAVVCLTLLTDSVQATYNYFDVQADPGTYSPVTMGEDFTLDACNSSFHRADSSSESYTLCQLSDITEFSLEWIGWSDYEWTSLGQYSGTTAADGLTVDVTTGNGTFFDDLGTYYVGLYLRVDGNSYVPLPGGGWAATGNDNSLSFNGSTNFSFAWSSAFSLTAASVPEPAAAFLLLPGLAYLGLRERRRRRSQAPKKEA